MSGHVFHPGHDELHGVTVIVTGASGRMYVGRWHERGERGITMRDVAIHDPASSPETLEQWLSKQEKFGVMASEKLVVVPNDEVEAVRVFGEAQP